MASRFFQKVKGYILHLFCHKKRKHHTVENTCFQKAMYFLLKDGHPVGKAKSRKHPEIRIIKVRNFTEAYQLFLRLCDQRSLRIRHAAGYIYYDQIFPNEKGSIEFSDKVTNKGKETIAILKVNLPDMKIPFFEIRFITM
ncbi:hypothetical protein DW095_09940 [Bacteroides sp. AM07-16]|nr:hypothetical protein DW095_09940 [Bacteroides sp. AM07-16]